MRSTARKVLICIAIALPIAASALAATGWVTSRPVESVRVVGEFNKVSSKALRARVMQVVDGGFFGIDVDAVRAAALSLPFVREVTVRRVWPDSIHIAVVERQAVARWNDEALLEDDGGVFVPRGELGHRNLVLLQGPDGEQEEVLRVYKLLQAALGGFGRGIRRLRLSARGGWELEFGNGLILVPHSPLDLEQLQGVVSMLPRLLGEELSRVARIDLRYANGFAVRWHGDPPQRERTGAARTRRDKGTRG